MPRAILSVYDKTGIEQFAASLATAGWELVATGNTAVRLRDAGLDVLAVEDVTGFPEILNGRVKTLHPRIHGGILADQGDAAQRQELKDHAISPIQLVVVNLYPFEATAQRTREFSELVENIDIGGPTLLRAAAKNCASVIPLVDPSDYAWVAERLGTTGPSGFSLVERQHMAAKVFNHTAYYDSLVARVFTASGQSGSGTSGEASWPHQLVAGSQLQRLLRYGENPHQQAALYTDPLAAPGLAQAESLQGKGLSYNNLNDAQAAWACLQDLNRQQPGRPLAVGLKHTNPCGVARGETLLEAWERAFAADSKSIFGGIVALNQVVDEDTAAALVDIFLEVILAPGYTAAAREVLKQKKNLRLLQLPLAGQDQGQVWPSFPALQRISGGWLVQEPDQQLGEVSDWELAAGEELRDDLAADCAFGWGVVKHVKSNAIVVCHQQQTLGVGAGQMNRIDAAQIALHNAGERARGAVLTSDAFFPFADVVEAAAAAGIAAIVQPGGSIRDQESIDAARQAGITMLFTGQRHFKH